MILFIKITRGSFLKTQVQGPPQDFVSEVWSWAWNLVFKPPIQVIKMEGLYLINGQGLRKIGMDEWTRSGILYKYQKQAFGT